MFSVLLLNTVKLMKITHYILATTNERNLARLKQVRDHPLFSAFLQEYREYIKGKEKPKLYALILVVL